MSLLVNSFLGLCIISLVLWLIARVKAKLRYFADRHMDHIAPTWSDALRYLSFTSFNVLPLEMDARCGDDARPYTGFFVTALRPAVLIRDPGLGRAILTKDFSQFQDHGFEFDFVNNPLAGHLFNMKGDQWRTLRHKLVPTFTSGKLRAMVPAMERCADALIEEMRAHQSLRQDTNLKDLFKKYSLSVIASCAFGIDPASVKDPKCQFVRILQRVVNPGIKDLLCFFVYLMLPKMALLFKIRMFPREVEEFMLSLTKDTMEMRRRSGVKRNDFIQLLLELKDKGSVELDSRELEHDETEALACIRATNQPSHYKLELTDELLTAQVFVFLVGGYENTAYVIAVTDYLISKHPEIQDRVRQEVLQCCHKHGALNYEALREMKLLEASIDEALRLYTAAMLIVRESTKPYTFPDGKKIDKGMLVFMPALRWHKDGRYWSDPETYNPDRFIEDTLQPGTYMPFGDGPRICIAQRMAKMVTKMMLAKLLLNFDLTPSSKTKEPIRIKSIGADNEGGFWGSFASRD